MDGRPGGRHHQTGKQPVCHSESSEVYFLLPVEFPVINLNHLCGLSSTNLVFLWPPKAVNVVTRPRWIVVLSQFFINLGWILLW